MVAHMKTFRNTLLLFSLISLFLLSGCATKKDLSEREKEEIEEKNELKWQEVQTKIHRGDADTSIRKKRNARERGVHYQELNIYRLR